MKKSRKEYFKKYNSEHYDTVKETIRRRKYRQRNKDKDNKYQREYRESNLRKERNWVLLRAYGITIEQYEAMSREQNNLCAICGKPEKAVDRNGNLRRLCVDHNHTTGKVRQLLCSYCNVRLSHLEDIEFITKARMYLEKHGG
jgi:hypothetical protein